MKSVGSRRLLIVLLLALPGLFAPFCGVAFGADPPQTTNINLSLGQNPRPGEALHIGARLTDAAGAPIPNAKISFAIPATFFLGVNGDMQIAESTTSASGVAEAEYEVRDSGWLTIRADYRGNERLNSASATEKVMIEGAPRQLYQQRAGVVMPGFNAASSEMAAMGEVSRQSEQNSSRFGRLFPTLSFWPIGLVLLIIWSLYGLAVVHVFRIARAGSDSPLPPTMR